MNTWPDNTICCTGEDLVLRVIREHDAHALGAIQPGDLSCSQGEWAFPPNNPLPWIQAGLKALSEQTGFRAGIWQGEILAGFVSLMGVHKGNRSAAISYALDSRFRGLGIMTRACHALCDYAFSSLELNRLQIECDVANTPSRAVAERLGFILEGILRDRYRGEQGFRDCVLYSCLAREWKVTKYV